MKFDYITIMVRDIEKSISFYENLVGLKTVRELHPPQGKIAFLANGAGETMLELISFPDTEKVSAASLVMSYKAEESLEALREKAVSAGYSPTEIIDRPPKPKHFRVLDPDSLTIEFSE